MPFEQCGSAKAWKKSSRCVVWRAAPTTAPSASHLSKCLHFLAAGYVRVFSS